MNQTDTSNMAAKNINATVAGLESGTTTLEPPAMKHAIYVEVRQISYTCYLIIIKILPPSSLYY